MELLNIPSGVLSQMIAIIEGVQLRMRLARLGGQTKAGYP